ncbi:MAG: hypothetical protein KDD50_16735, partial [Bdellovibrionales bacterium]|nr:hypothetical protein [Bdellovibrionales bacterium]
HTIDFVPEYDEIHTDPNETGQQIITLHDGSHLILHPIDAQTHNVNDRFSAIEKLTTAREEHKVLTGLFYLNENKPNLMKSLELVETPLTQIQESDLRITQNQLDEIIQDFL